LAPGDQERGRKALVSKVEMVTLVCPATIVCELAPSRANQDARVPRDFND